ncbi:type VI secretion system ATPase TssH [Hahella sp. KA22]|uniref:type VI secretion system ATPase TssH n=1 Tax=Hahella sp. KA22 TaxID=1628392 RepID=UPI000FDD3CDE|nr:type VI secretion system ATPase TssH [Hahella sp. KA22]AZZ93150.1 type VI secretion system ATPase TssH [Hahella sp. KA22]QAY56524.1 type VI secretion system ATPase TssH [Hahella sp. KA22]
MIELNLRQLIEPTTSVVRKSLEDGLRLAQQERHSSLEIEHVLLKVLEQSDSDLDRVLEQLGVDIGKISRELSQTVGKFHRDNPRDMVPFSPLVVDALKAGWLLASVEMGVNFISSAHLFAAIMSHNTMRNQLLSSVKTLQEISLEKVLPAVKAVTGQSSESRAYLKAAAGGGAPAAPTAQGGALQKYTVNLTERALNNEIDPVLGRDPEIRQCIDILTRRRQNNPILTGEAGVGKTAVVEGLALRIAQKDVPEPLQGVHIHVLDLGLLQAGASMKGEFEQRLKSVIEEVKASPVPIIMFIDEAHTMIGAGGKEGQGDAANLLKPALARGELRTIAATTWAEYKKYFERDPALTRRFQVVKVEEPSETVAIDMLRGISKILAIHHNVRISDDAIIQAVKLSARYIPGRQLPDKGVSLLDTACARVSLSQSATPSLIEDTRRRIQQIDTNLDLISQENISSGEYHETLDLLTEEKAALETSLAAQTEQWEKEKDLIAKILDVRTKLEQDFQAKKGAEDAGDRLSDEEVAELQVEFKNLFAALASAQGDQPLMMPHVDGQAVAEVVANWTGIPVGKMVSDEINGILNLHEQLEKRVIGQSHALEAVAQAIRTSRAGLTDPRKPIGVFLMVGPSGVGKTETALALADTLFGGEQNLTVINMSEFKEEHKVSMLLGSPPGYVGYGEGGVLTEAARRKPYSVILLDEMEKAHQGVQDVFYNLFDKGTIKDGEGRDIDFKNTVIIMTSNAGEEAIRAICSQSEEKPEPDVMLDSMRHELLKYFKPAFMGRANVITYYPLDDENLFKICRINMDRIARRVRNHYGAAFTYDEDVLLNIVARSQEVDTGARNIEHILNRTVLPELSTECLSRLANGEHIEHIHISATEEGNFGYLFNAEAAAAASAEPQAVVETDVDADVDADADAAE